MFWIYSKMDMLVINFILYKKKKDILKLILKPVCILWHSTHHEILLLC